MMSRLKLFVGGRSFSASCGVWGSFLYELEFSESVEYSVVEISAAPPHELLQT